jgi:hypothetical protein
MLMLTRSKRRDPSPFRLCRKILAPHALLVLLAGCQDQPLPLAPAADEAARPVAPLMVRTARGDVVTNQAEAFDRELAQAGEGAKVLVWLKERETPPPAPEFLLGLPGRGGKTIALSTDPAGAPWRRNLGPSSVRRSSVDAVIHALVKVGGVEIRRMDVLPLVVARLPATNRLQALRLLLANPNVDYVSIARVHRVQLSAAPLGSNPTDAKHTFHHVPEAWDFTRGSGVKIGVLDSGFAYSFATGLFHDDMAVGM